MTLWKWSSVCQHSETGKTWTHTDIQTHTPILCMAYTSEQTHTGVKQCKEFLVKGTLVVVCVWCHQPPSSTVGLLWGRGMLECGWGESGGGESLGWETFCLSFFLSVTDTSRYWSTQDYHLCWKKKDRTAYASTNPEHMHVHVFKELEYTECAQRTPSWLMTFLTIWKHFWKHPRPPIPDRTYLTWHIKKRQLPSSRNHIPTRWEVVR